jgi:uncharacterized metal-binding protein
LSTSGSSKYQLLPHCATHAKDLIIIATCDGTSSTGQIGNEVTSEVNQDIPKPS